MQKLFMTAKLSAKMSTGAVLVFLTSTAAAEGLFLGVEAGLADADLGDVAIFSDGSTVTVGSDDAILTGGLSARYSWSNDVFVEVGYQSYESLSVVLLTDAVELETIRAAVGYYLPGDSRLRVMGKAGVSFWELQARESLVFTPGPEEETTLDGSDLFAEVGLEYRFTERSRAGLSLSYQGLDDGSATSLNLSFRLGL